MARRPFKPHELAQHRRGQLKSLAWAGAVLGAMAWLAAAEDSTIPLPAPSVFRTGFALMGFLMMLSCLILELYWMPMPQDPKLPGAKPKDVSKWAIISSPIGILCFLTCQIMCAASHAREVPCVARAQFLLSIIQLTHLALSLWKNQRDHDLCAAGLVCRRGVAPHVRHSFQRRTHLCIPHRGVHIGSVRHPHASIPQALLV